jgi:transketolase
MTTSANSGHPGGSLSAVEIVTALYFNVMRHDPKDPAWADRDRFVMSKGHATPVIYGVLAEAGYFPMDDLLTFRKLGGKLQGHVVMGKPAGVEMSAGALGMGLSFSLGQALAGRLDKKGYHVYGLLSDGDSQEGQTWEAAMASGHHKPGNLVALVDRNHIHNDGYSDFSHFPGDGNRPEHIPGGWVLPDGHTANIMDLEPFADKWKAFGWKVWHVQNGHDFGDVIKALKEATDYDDGPAVVIFETTKGKGVKLMENNPDYHGKAATPEQLKQALNDLGFED